MKKLLTVALITFLIVGCASRPPTALDNNFDDWIIVNGKIQTWIGSFLKYRKLAYRYDSDNYTVFIKTEGEAVINSKNCGMSMCIAEKLYSAYYPNLCKEIFGTSVKYNNNTTYRTSNLWGGNFKFYPQITSATCYAPEEHEQLLAQYNQQQQALQDKAIAQALENKKTKCRTYGFTDNSDGMGLCLIELDKLAVMEQQIADIQKNNQAQTNLLREQQADAKRQREAQALMNMGAMIGGYGTSSSSSKSKIDSTPTLPQHSFTRNVQYNQNCPILTGTYKVKEETIGTNKICYYK